MVHNGIEYGMMQAFAEGYELLAGQRARHRRRRRRCDVVAARSAWCARGCSTSWSTGLEREPDLDGIAPVAKDSGEGRWTVDEAVRLGVPAPVIAGVAVRPVRLAAASRTAMKVVAAAPRTSSAATQCAGRRPTASDEPASSGHSGLGRGAARRPTLRRPGAVRRHRRPGPQEAVPGRLQDGAQRLRSTCRSSAWRRRSGPTTTCATGPGRRSRPSTSTPSTSRSSAQVARCV